MYHRILVPVDGSETSNAGLAEARKLARITGGQIQLLHVIDDMPMMLAGEGYGAISADVMGVWIEAGRALLSKARTAVEQDGVPVDSVLVETPGSRLSDAVMKQALKWQADLIVLGTHGRRGVGRVLLGSDAEQVVRSSPVPVLLVRASDPAIGPAVNAG